MVSPLGLLLAIQCFAGTDASFEHGHDHHVDLPTYATYQATVRWVPNNPESVSTKSRLMSTFCSHFGVMPCTPGSKSPAGVQLASDFVVMAPAAQLSEVMLMLGQYRTLLASKDSLLSLELNPLDHDGQVVSQMAGRMGQFDHIKLTDVQSVTLPASETGNSSNFDSIGNFVVEPWTHACSYPGHGDLCQKPYAGRTECNSQDVQWHVHIFYAPNDMIQVRAHEMFRAITNAQFGIDWEHRCPDVKSDIEFNQGRVCWLTWPDGREKPYPNYVGGSFTTSFFSMFLPAHNLTEVLPWLMEYTKSKHIGADLDVLVHPNTGCAWPDHVYWPLLIGQRWSTNAYGLSVQDSFAPDTKLAPAADPRAANHSARPVESCKDDADITQYTLLLEYNPDQHIQAKQALEQIGDFWQKTFSTKMEVEDFPLAYTNSRSPCTASCAVIKATSSMLTALVPMVPALQSEGLDLRLVPHGFNCTWREFADFSLRSGDTRRPVNDNAFGFGQEAMQQARESETSSDQDHPSSFMIYAIGESTNAWSIKALGNFADSFAADFGTRRNESYPWMAEPRSHDECQTFDNRPSLMEEQWLAYEDNYAIFPQIFVPIYVPAESMQKVLPWVLRHRQADKVGYEIDIAVVPLTGNATRDYSESHWWSGRKWRVNQFAMQAAMDYAPESKVRFYREETARRVEEPGVVRYEWVSKSGVGNYDLSLGDPSITRLELSGHGLPSSSRQQMNFDFDFQYVILEGNCTFTVESPSGTSNVTEVMQPDEMFWVRAGVSHRIDTVPPGAPLKLVALGGPWQPYTVEVLDDMVYNIFEDPNAQRVVDPQTFYRNADFRSYRFADTPWVRPEGFGDIVHKVWNKSMQNNDDVAYFSVKLAPNQWVRKHYHPTGAVYIVVKGSMTFPGEGRLDKFEVRWTAPDHFYAGERSDAKEETLLAVPGHLGPQFTSGPPHHNYLLEHRANLHVVHRDTSAHPMSRVAGRVFGSGSVASPRPLEPVYV